MEPTEARTYTIASTPYVWRALEFLAAWEDLSMPDFLSKCAEHYAEEFCISKVRVDVDKA